MLAKIISRIQRNHGLEHATIHVLSTKQNNFSAQGHSGIRGFHLNIYGDVPENVVIESVEEAFRRMKNGEHELAVHPNCGTVLLTTATMATVAAQAAFSVEHYRRKGSRFSPAFILNAMPSAILAAVVALILSRPVGLHIQRKYTTDGDLGDMQLLRVRRISASPITYIFQMLLKPGQKINSTSYMIETTG